MLKDDGSLFPNLQLETLFLPCNYTQAFGLVVWSIFGKLFVLLKFHLVIPEFATHQMISKKSCTWCVKCWKSHVLCKVTLGDKMLVIFLLDGCGLYLEGWWWRPMEHHQQCVANCWKSFQFMNLMVCVICSTDQLLKVYPRGFSSSLVSER